MKKSQLDQFCILLLNMPSKFKTPIILLSSLIPNSFLISCSLPQEINRPTIRQPTSFPTIPQPKEIEDNSINNPQKIFNSTIEKISSKQYLFDFPNYWINKETFFGTEKITLVLFSILFSKKLNKAEQISKLNHFLDNLKKYQDFLEKNESFKKEEQAFYEFFNLPKKQDETIIDSIINFVTNKTKFPNPDNISSPNNELKFETPEWWKIEEDYLTWFKSKYLKKYKSFSALRMKNGDLSTLAEKEKEMIKLQSSELYFASTLLFQPLEIFQKTKKSLSLISSIAKLNLLILKNKEIFNKNTLEIKSFFQSKKQELNLEILESNLKFILSLKNNWFFQLESSDNKKEIQNYFFLPIETNDFNTGLFFNDILILLDLILNPILSITKPKNANWFEATLNEEYKYFSKYLYNQIDLSSQIKFYKLDNSNKNSDKKIQTYIKNYFN
ncbi:hypothetical protein [Metamycoplasma alkalescens]|nr:hypothetical protein [Metamycoplasma alkalescens]